MRSVAWLLPVAVLVAAGSGAAQVSSPLFELTVSSSSSVVAPGNTTQMELQATRVCPSAATVLGEQAASLVIQHRPDVAVAGAGQLLFRSQVCANQPQQVVATTLSITLPSDYNGTEVIEFEIALQPHPGSGPTVGGWGDEASLIYVVKVDRAESMAIVASEQQAPLEAPSFPAILLAVALLASAFALRRR